MAVDMEDEDELEINGDGRLPGGHLAGELVRWDSLDIERPKRQFCRDTLVLTNMLAVCNFPRGNGVSKVAGSEQTNVA